MIVSVIQRMVWKFHQIAVSSTQNCFFSPFKRILFENVCIWINTKVTLLLGFRYRFNLCNSFQNAHHHQCSSTVLCLYYCPVCRIFRCQIETRCLYSLLCFLCAMLFRIPASGAYKAFSKSIQTFKHFRKFFRIVKHLNIKEYVMSKYFVLPLLLSS